MVPSAFTALERMPHNASAKVDRAALPEPDWAAAAEDHVPPRGHVEETLARVWAEVLGVPRVGAHDDFFDLGGDSIAAVRVASRTAAALRTRVAPRALFQAPTVASSPNCWPPPPSRTAPAPRTRRRRPPATPRCPSRTPSAGCGSSTNRAPARRSTTRPSASG
ncbi:phosphopantetheine-binding protein [Streptomyces sp. AD16]|nr:phosphopantetheine-binding protein [Streptomyces sp. AD16]